MNKRKQKSKPNDQDQPLTKVSKISELFNNYNKNLAWDVKYDSDKKQFFLYPIPTIYGLDYNSIEYSGNEIF